MSGPLSSARQPVLIFVLGELALDAGLCLPFILHPSAPSHGLPPSLAAMNAGISVALILAVASTACCTLTGIGSTVIDRQINRPSSLAACPPMRVDAFRFFSSEGQIALRPADPRDAARMFIVHADGSFEHAVVRDLPHYLNPATHLSSMTRRSSTPGCMAGA